MSKDNHWVMDYETLANCFLSVFEHYKTIETKVFTIGRLRNDLVELLEFFDSNIENSEWHISFNGISFDSQITQYILANRKKLLKLSGEQAAKLIYEESQKVIKRSNNREFPKYSEYKLSIKQLDIFKLNHWDNPAKSSSLKWIQCSMDWPNVQDMPIHHTEKINSVEKLKGIAGYCRNDVSSTKAIMNKNKKEIKLRSSLSKHYGVNLYSASETKIAKEVFLYFLSKQTGISKYELKQLRTYRSSIEVKDLILPYIQFDNPEFKELLRNFRNLVIDPNQTKGKFKYTINYRGVKSKFGFGGIHGAKKGLFESDDHMVIMTSDVKSYYPNLAIRNNWSPAHLPNEHFCKIYEWFYDERLKIPKSDSRNYVYKIVLNATFGLGNDKHSFLYDPAFSMKITINGQLSLLVLYEMITENIPGAVPLMQNTDGLETMIPRKYEKKYIEICNQWEQMTKLVLEHDTYQKIVIPDVNNYIGIFSDEELNEKEWLKKQKESPDNLFKKQNGKFYMAKTKCKGRFEYKDKPLHKNKSFPIIPKAVYNYFVHGKSIEQTLLKDQNIYNYCGQVKAIGDWIFNEVSLKDNALHYEPIQKTLRYYVSNNGSKILKCNKIDKREINIEAGKWKLQEFNKYVKKPFDDYNIDMKYYIDRIKREIINIEPEAFSNQLKLNF